MKLKTTRKEIKKQYGSSFLFQTGYCDLQNLLAFERPIAYTCGVYGWNFDLYEVEGRGITTGYRNMVGQEISHELAKKYEKLAEINRSWENKRTFEQKKELAKKILKRFIKELYR